MRKITHFRVAPELKLQDMWVGVYWRTDDVEWEHHYTRGVDVWICLLPCLPIHMRVAWRVPKVAA